MIPKILLVTSSSSLASAARLARDLICRLGPATIRALDVTKLGDDDIAAVDAVILMLDAHLPVADASSLLHALEDHGILALVQESPSGPTTEGWFSAQQVLPAGMPAAHVAGLLDGMLRSRPEVHGLRSELDTAMRFHSGLEDRIMRIQEELQTAARIQKEFLPAELPPVHGVEFSALWRPAHFVSGDIYDVQRLDDDHVGLFIADCVGHGVPAALMTMTIVHALAMRVLRGGRMDTLEPGEVLERLNDDLVRNQSGTPRFATAVYAVLNCRTRRLRLAGAGHPAPLLISSDGRQRELSSDGGLLGIFPQATFNQVECTLEPGDRLMFFSDGFEQAFPCPDRGPTGRAAPADVIHGEFARAARKPEADEIIAALSQRLDDQAGSLHPHDDLTLLCTLVGPPAEPHPAHRAERDAVHASAVTSPHSGPRSGRASKAS